VRAEYHIPVPGSRELWLATIALLVVACGPEAEPPRIAGATLPIDSRATVLDAPALARDALDREGLLALLDEVGFVAASERTGSDRPAGLDRVVVRAVSFASPEGADAYVGWLRAHAGDVIGAADTLAPFPLPGQDEEVPLFRHDPGDCCPKATVAYLAAWRDGSTAVTLEMAGRDVDVDVFVATAGALEVGET
jgi:hypothetical protein